RSEGYVHDSNKKQCSANCRTCPRNRSGFGIALWKEGDCRVAARSSTICLRRRTKISVLVRRDESAAPLREAGQGPGWHGPGPYVRGPDCGFGRIFGPGRAQDPLLV